MHTDLQNNAYLEELRAAAARLEGDCRRMLEAQGQDGRAGERARLSAAITHMRQLLAAVPAPLQAREHNTERATERAAGCGRGSHNGEQEAGLLRLPGDLLRRVGALAGKEARAVCRRLRDTYGPPALTVRQPCVGYEVGPLTRQFGYSDRELQAQVLRRGFLHHHAALPSLAALGSCARRWPAWGRQVTRLQLSSACAPDAPSLRGVHALLPGLLQLQAAGLSCGSAPAAEVPRFSRLTQLCLVAACRDCAVGSTSRDPPRRLDLLCIAPNLRELHLDLRFANVDPRHLHEALRPLAQLTRLELAYGLEREWIDWRGPDAALVAGRLRSLLLLAPCMRLGRRMAALTSMTALTSLGCCIDVNDFPAPQGRESLHVVYCSLVPSLRRLVLALPSAYNGSVSARGVALLLDAFRHPQVLDMPALQALVLPVVFVVGARTGTPADPCQRRLHALLSLVASKCAGLTSLRVGYTGDNRPVAPAPHQLPDPLAWPTPLGRLQQLRQLVLVCDAHELSGLGCLGGLPLLAELWLDLCHVEVLQPASWLARMQALKRLAVRFQAATQCDCDAMAQALLAHAIAAPALEVLDTSNMAWCCASAAPWEVLAAAQVACLAEVRIGRLPAAGSGLAGGPQAAGTVRGVVELLTSRLGGRGVRVVVEPSGSPLAVPSSGPRGPEPWGPCPCALMELSMVRHA